MRRVLSKGVQDGIVSGQMVFCNWPQPLSPSPGKKLNYILRHPLEKDLLTSSECQGGSRQKMGAGQGHTTGKKEQECRRSQAHLKTCLRTLAV